MIVPVAVETPLFDTELVLHNPSDSDATVTLRYFESLGGAGSAEASLPLAAHAQLIVSRLFDLLREGRATADRR